LRKTICRFVTHGERKVIAGSSGGASGARLEYPLQSFGLSDESDGRRVSRMDRAGQAATVTLESKRFTMRRKVVNDAAA
jgi:hypothetical protein